MRVVELKEALRAHDFDALAFTTDTWFEAHGKLRGVVIHCREFPGWEDLTTQRGCDAREQALAWPPTPRWVLRPERRLQIASLALFSGASLRGELRPVTASSSRHSARNMQCI